MYKFNNDSRIIKPTSYMMSCVGRISKFKRKQYCDWMLIACTTKEQVVNKLSRIESKTLTRSFESKLLETNRYGSRESSSKREVCELVHVFRGFYASLRLSAPTPMSRPRDATAILFIFKNVIQV